MNKTQVDYIEKRISKKIKECMARWCAENPQPKPPPILELFDVALKDPKWLANVRKAMRVCGHGDCSISLSYFDLESYSPAVAKITKAHYNELNRQRKALECVRDNMQLEGRRLIDRAVLNNLSPDEIVEMIDNLTIFME